MGLHLTCARVKYTETSRPKAVTLSRPGPIDNFYI